MENKNHNFCSSCGSPVGKDSSVCPACGAQLSDAAGPAPNALNEPSVVCPFCGKPVNWWDGKCPHCGGERFSEDQNAPTVYLDAKEAENVVRCEKCGEYYDKRTPHICRAAAEQKAEAGANSGENNKMKIVIVVFAVLLALAVALIVVLFVKNNRLTALSGLSGGTPGASSSVQENSAGQTASSTSTAGSSETEGSSAAQTSASNPLPAATVPTTTASSAAPATAASNPPAATTTKRTATTTVTRPPAATTKRTARPTTTTRRTTTTTRRTTTTTRRTTTTTRGSGGLTYPTDSGIVYTEDFERACADALNAKRRAAGVGDVRYDMSLARLAAVRVKEVKRVFDNTGTLSHNRPDGRKYTTVFTDYGFSRPAHSGENVGWARWFNGPSDMIGIWMDSPAHKTNMLASKFKKFGMAKYETGDRTFIVLLLTN